MKKLFSIITLCLLVAVMFSCKDDTSKSDLIRLVGEMNQQCPIEMDYVTCQSVEIQGNDVIMNYMIDEDMLSLDVMKQKPDLAKKYGGSSIFNENADTKLGDLILKSGCDFIANYKGSTSGDVVSLKFTNDEIKDIKAHPISKEELLDWDIEATNSLLPKKLDYVTTLVSLTRDGDVVTYTYEIDENELDMATVIAGKKQLKETLASQIAELNSPTSTAQTFMRLLRGAGKDLHYVYQGNESGQSLEIEFTNSELNEMLNQSTKE